MGAARSFVVIGTITATVIVLATTRGQSAGPTPPAWRERFATAMEKVRFDSEQAPVFYPGTPKGVYPKGAESLRIATPSRRDSGSVGRVIARIRSDSGYPRLGIAAGTNYLWQEADGRSVRFLVIPANATAPMKWLNVRHHEHRWPTRRARLVIMEDSTDGGGGALPVPPPPTSPTVKALTFLCSSDCTSSSVQWCTAKDTSKLHATLASPTSALVAEVGHYFARNRVSWNAP
jgi:hypothetical protein